MATAMTLALPHRCNDGDGDGTKMAGATYRSDDGVSATMAAETMADLMPGLG
jgi:hypothetical protein